jgi:hypothetical protein
VYAEPLGLTPPGHREAAVSGTTISIHSRKARVFDQDQRVSGGSSLRICRASGSFGKYPWFSSLRTVHRTQTLVLLNGHAQNDCLRTLRITGGSRTFMVHRPALTLTAAHERRCTMPEAVNARPSKTEDWHRRKSCCHGQGDTAPQDANLGKRSIDNCALFGFDIGVPRTFDLVQEPAQSAMSPD